jgi:uncharacterized YigZ family protein
MSLTYKTVLSTSEFLIKEKGSKFIGLCSPCTTEEKVKLVLAEWHQLHPQATHICYAYRIGVKQQRYRANDDGEPSNSAGTPILGQIQSFELTNVLIGVVRYYGGTKLGVGGLVSAYKAAAKAVIEENTIIEKEIANALSFSFTYADMPAILNKLKYWNVSIMKQEIDLLCHLEIEYPQSKSFEIKNFITSFSSVEIEQEQNEL